MEKALAGLLNAASGAEEVRSALVSRIAECAPLRLPAHPTQDPADIHAWTLKQTCALHKRPKRRHKRQARQCLIGCPALAFGPGAAGGYSEACTEECQTSASRAGLGVQVGGRPEAAGGHPAGGAPGGAVGVALGVHRGGARLQRGRLAQRRGRHTRGRLHCRQQAHAREGAHWKTIHLLLDTLLHPWVQASYCCLLDMCGSYSEDLRKDAKA